MKLHFDVVCVSQFSFALVEEIYFLSQFIYIFFICSLFTMKFLSFTLDLQSANVTDGDFIVRAIFFQLIGTASQGT